MSATGCLLTHKGCEGGDDDFMKERHVGVGMKRKVVRILLYTDIQGREERERDGEKKKKFSGKEDNPPVYSASSRCLRERLLWMGLSFFNDSMFSQ